MKILHTADLHLGHMLYNNTQEEAQKDMLRQMAEIVAQKQPDVFLISGDIYDTTQPGTAIQQMFADALVEFHQACEQMIIICIAGNHDSGSRHNIYQKPWLAHRVHMIGNINSDSNLNDYIVKIADKGYVAAIPYAAPRFMPDDVYQRAYQLIEEQNRVEQLPVVLAAHLAVKGSDHAGHDHATEVNIGGLDCLDSSVFGEGFDYVALGHIHRQQDLKENNRICYSGTPIAISFDEANYPHGMLYVECTHHHAGCKVSPVSINNSLPLVNIPEKGFAEWEEALTQLHRFPKDKEAFVRLNVEVDRFLHAGANDEAQHVIEDKRCILSTINPRRKCQQQQSNDNKTFTTAEFQKLDITDVAKLWFERKGEPFDEDIEEMLREIKEKLASTND